MTISQDEDECNNDDVIVGTAEGRQLTHEKAQNSSSESVKKRMLKVGYHHGALNPLSQAWKFSSMTSIQTVQNWSIGDLKRNTPTAQFGQ